MALTHSFKYRKQMSVYEELDELAMLLASTSPYRCTRNNFQRLKHKIVLESNINETEIYTLFDSLVHGITKLNQLYRPVENGHILSTKEDNLIALQLIQKLAFPKVSLKNKPIQIYNELWHAFQEDIFIIEEAYKVIKPFYPMHIGSLHRHFIELMHANRLKELKRFSNGRIIYKLKPIY